MYVKLRIFLTKNGRNLKIVATLIPSGSRPTINLRLIQGLLTQ